MTRTANGSGDHPSRVAAARGLLDAFLLETGVVGPEPPRRYLWTDAFAVCTLLGLHRAGVGPGPEGATYQELALRLVDQVHQVLGRHRDDDPRSGRLSGLEGPEAEAHPTAGGLRIGKPRPERRADEPSDPRLEWERDGQYFHYLTRWMHALLRTAQETGGSRYLQWALELAQVTYRGFVREGSTPGRRTLPWKMSIDLSRPLVTTPGHHDPLDGYLTFRTLRAAAREAGSTDPPLADGTAQFRDLAGVASGRGWATDDPLGLGGLMVDALRVSRLQETDGVDLPALLRLLLDSVSAGLGALRASHTLDGPVGFRIPFRELGLSLGIHALERLDPGESEEVLQAWHRLPELEALGEAARRIEKTWLDPANRSQATWTDHGDINAVALAASLAPDGYLGA